MVSLEDFQLLQQQVKGLLDQKTKDDELIKTLQTKVDGVSNTGKLDEPQEDPLEKKIAELKQDLDNDHDQIANWRTDIEEIEGRIKDRETVMSTKYDELQQLTGLKPSGTPFDDRGSEERIQLTFGEIVTAAALREFIVHYKGVRLLNTRNELKNWDDPSYRAEKLKLVLRGQPAKYVTGESNRAKEWTKDDTAIIDRLKERYMLNDAAELKMMEAEGTTQEDKEPLPDFMERVQTLMEEAYDGEPHEVIKKRIAWRFINGIRSREIRSALINERWMINKQEAKDPEELVRIAETTRRNMAVAAATGMNGSKGTLARTEGNSQDDNNQGCSTLAQMADSKKKVNKRTRRDFPKCEYCKRFHPGGWKDCWKRLREDPNWLPPVDRQHRQSSNSSQENKSRSAQGF